MTVEFLRIAMVELEDAVAYYNQQSEGFGYQFAVEVQKTLHRIVEFPEAWPVVSERTRRCRLRRFPYGVIYRGHAHASTPGYVAESSITTS